MVHKRWYDREQTLSKSIRLLESFPPEVQSIIAEGIIALAERECQAKELLTSLKSIGAEKVLGLYKAKQKRRTYDNDANVHKAMSYMYILTEKNQAFMANEILAIIQHIYEYFKTCKAFEAKPEVDEVAQMTRTYVEAGGPEVQKFLSKVKEKLISDLNKIPVARDMEESIQDDAQGMKIRES